MCVRVLLVLEIEDYCFRQTFIVLTSTLPVGFRFFIKNVWKWLDLLATTMAACFDKLNRTECS